MKCEHCGRNEEPTDEMVEAMVSRGVEAILDEIGYRAPGDIINRLHKIALAAAQPDAQKERE